MQTLIKAGLAILAVFFGIKAVGVVWSFIVAPLLAAVIPFAVLGGAIYVARKPLWRKFSELVTSGKIRRIGSGR